MKDVQRQKEAARQKLAGKGPPPCRVPSLLSGHAPPPSGLLPFQTTCGYRDNLLTLAGIGVFAFHDIRVLRYVYQWADYDHTGRLHAQCLLAFHGVTEAHPNACDA